MTFVYPISRVTHKYCFPFRYPRMLRKNSQQFTNDFGWITRRFSRRVKGARNQRVVFVSPRILDSRFTTRRLHSLWRNSREKELTKTQIFKAQSPPDLRKGSGGWNPRGVLIQSAETCESFIRPRTRIQLIPLSPSQFTAVTKLALNTLSTSSKQQFVPEILTQMELPEGMISYNELL